MSSVFLRAYYKVIGVIESFLLECWAIFQCDSVTLRNQRCADECLITDGNATYRNRLQLRDPRRILPHMPSVPQPANQSSPQRPRQWTFSASICYNVCLLVWLATLRLRVRVAIRYARRHLTFPAASPSLGLCDISGDKSWAVRGHSYSPSSFHPDKTLNSALFQIPVLSPCLNKSQPCKTEEISQRGRKLFRTNSRLVNGQP